MKACVLHAVGNLRCETTSTRALRVHEVLIKVRACGVCGSDIPRVFVKGTSRFPTIPGHEFAGEVVEAGAGVDGGVVGRRVAVFPLIPCRRCGPCQVKAYAQCEDYDYLGSRSDGGFAEYARAPEWNLLPIPDEVSFEEAAMLEPAAVGLHALRRAEPEKGESILVFGAGPIGLLLAFWARVLGAGSILLTDIDDAKLEFARGLGFDAVFNVKHGGVADWVKDRTRGGADIVIEASGSSAAFEQCMPAARPFGRVVLMGNPAGEMKLSQQTYWAVLRKELRVLGTWNSTYGIGPEDDWHVTLESIASGRLNVRPLITDRVDLDQLPGTLAMMRDGAGSFCKVMYVAPEEKGSPL